MFKAIAETVQPLLRTGKVASYIPALAEISPDQFAMALCTVGGKQAMYGATDEHFSIQSISKVFTLACAIRLLGEKLWQRIGREPSGDPFNSLIQLEHENGRPRNPLINAGAICVADHLISHTADAKTMILEFVSELCGDNVQFDLRVAESERVWGYRNAALANFMKSFGNLENDVDTVLDVYFHQCSITMTCAQLAKAMGFLANQGVAPPGDQRIVSTEQTRRINSLMLTCGTYDAAGEFAFRVGLPCKSGVGGGIVAVVPDELSVCVWAPSLGPSGNSVAGFKALELFVNRSGLSIF
jgi:glutaminase